MEDLNIHSENISEIMPALISAIGKLEDIKKNEQGHNYRYATLPAVLKELRPVLRDHDLACMQNTQIINNEAVLITTVYHKSGQWVRSFYSLVKAGLRNANEAQQIGAAISYARRYSLISMFFIASEDEDDDARCLKYKIRYSEFFELANTARYRFQQCQSMKQLDEESEKIVKEFNKAGFDDLNLMRKFYVENRNRLQGA